jgi:transcriptional regulator with XRE-family HTH domain
MDNLTVEQLAFAVATLENLVNARGLTQTQLEHLAGVKQSQISKVLTRQADPSPEVLVKLFKALGLKLEDILHDAPVSSASELLGYLATPLTAVVASPGQNAELERVVAELRRCASTDEFVNPRFNLYWPGDYTHPARHPDFRPNQVYLTDRSRASTFDFIVIFCASPSYGVGQENEIATQAGLPAIRLIHPGISRMMSGSFLQAIDVEYAGSLEHGITFDSEQYLMALRQIRKTHFRHRALFRGVNGNDFGKRLRALLDDRSGDYQGFAADLGVNLLYVESLMNEPFTVSNPSARLLKRMGSLLNISVGYLLGEGFETDPVLQESLGTWNSWVDSTTGLDAAIANRIKKDWHDDYSRSRKQAAASIASQRNNNGAMRGADWDKKYQEALKKAKGGNGAQQQGFF